MQAVSGFRPDVESKFKNLVKEGFEYIKTTRKTGVKDRGSFLTNQQDKQGSIKTTAKVMKILKLVKPWNFGSNDDLIVQGLNFLKGKQATDGHWETDEMRNEQIADLDQNVLTTADVVTAFLENVDYKERYTETITKALDFVRSKLNEVTDQQTLAVSAYAMSFDFFDDTLRSIERLNEKCKKTDEDKILGWNYDSDIEVEIAAYVILAYENIRRVEKSKDVIDFLLSRRLNEGKFSTIENTNLGIKALAAVSKHLHTDKTNIKVDLDNESHKRTVHVTNDNHETEVKLHGPGGVSVNFAGTGVAYTQCYQSYRVHRGQHGETFNEDFDIKVTPDAILNELKICVKNKSNRRSYGVNHLIQVQLPSGFEFEKYEDTKKFVKVRKHTK